MDEFQSTRLLRGATDKKLAELTPYAFQSTRLLRGATSFTDAPLPHVLFQSTRLLRGATLYIAVGESVRQYFNPRASCEARHATRAPTPPAENFNPRASCEARLYMSVIVVLLPLFQSTRLLRGATLKVTHHIIQSAISIHAPLARRDRSISVSCQSGTISIHAPLARRDIKSPAVRVPSRHFNPRASCEARPTPKARPRLRRHFNPRASCEARRLPWSPLLPRFYFNPRASCEARPKTTTGSTRSVSFQSTRLLRGATYEAP